MKKTVFMALVAMMCCGTGANAQNNVEYQNYVESLAAPVRDGGLYGAMRNLDIDGVVAMTFANADELNAKMPSLPTIAQVSALDPAPAHAWQAYKKGSLNYFETLSAKVQQVMLTSPAIGNSAVGLGNSPMAQMGSAMELLAELQREGIDPENITEEQAVALMKKRLANGQVKMPANASAIPSYSEAQEETMDELDELIEALQLHANEAMSGALTGDAFGLNHKLQAYYDEMQQAWLTSDACKQVRDIETDIDTRAKEYLRNHPGAEAYPAYWVEGRKKQNQLIDGFNQANAQKWLKAIEEVLENGKLLLAEFSTVDNQLEDAFSNKQDRMYAMMKQRVIAAIFPFMISLCDVPDMAYDLPQVCGVSEDPSNVVGM